MQEQYDYSAELVHKWTATGHLQNVKEDDKTRVAARLEAAYRRTLGQRPDFSALEKELSALMREGLFGRSMNSRQHRR